MCLATFQLRQLFQRQLSQTVRCSTHRKRYQHLIHMQTRIAAAKVACFQILNRVDVGWRNQVHFIRNTAQFLNSVQQHGTGRSQQIRSFAGNDSAIGKLQRNNSALAFFRNLLGYGNNAAVIYADLSLLHQQLQRINLLLASLIQCQTVQGLIIATDNFLTGSLTADLIITDAVACHINAHISRRFVRAIAVNTFKDCCKYGINFNVTVIIYRGYAISLQMEGVNHINILQIRRSSLISHVYRMLQRQIPDGEGFEFSITGLNAALVFMIQL